MPGCDPVQPDLLVIRTANLDIITPDGIEGVLALLIEILSPGNIATDTDIKRHAYARAGVPEYWVVRPETRDVLILSAPDAALEDYTSSARRAGRRPRLAHAAHPYRGRPLLRRRAGRPTSPAIKSRTRRERA